VGKRAKNGWNTTLETTDYTDYYRFVLLDASGKLYFSIGASVIIDIWALILFLSRGRNLFESQIYVADHCCSVKRSAVLFAEKAAARSIASLLWLLCIASLTSAEPVRMGFANTIPPYTIPETSTGIELDIVREALALKNHTLIINYMPLSRMPGSFVLGDVDAVMTDFGTDLSALNGHYAEPVILFNNRFYSLKDRNLQISKPSDIKGLSIVAFPGAQKRFPEWLKDAQAEGLYHEIKVQKLQILLLFAGRYDLVLSDKVVFQYFFSQQLKNNNLQAKPLSEHDVFVERPLDYRPVFKSQKVRDDFNEGLQVLKSSGRYQEIFDAYLAEPPKAQ